MIIIKIIILYYIQIRHTGDFPSTGTRLVLYNIVKTMNQCCVMVCIMANGPLVEKNTNLQA